MKIQQFSYNSRKESNERFPEDFVKSFYYRCGLDCGWEEYKEMERESGWLAEIKEALENFEWDWIRDFAIIYTMVEKDRYDISAIINFGSRGITDDFERDFANVLIWDSGNSVVWAGVDVNRILFSESY